MMAHNAYGYGLFTGGLGYHYGAERLGCAVVPVSGGMTERQVQLISILRPTSCSRPRPTPCAWSTSFAPRGSTRAAPR